MLIALVDIGIYAGLVRLGAICPCLYLDLLQPFDSLRGGQSLKMLVALCFEYGLNNKFGTVLVYRGL